MPYKEKHKIVWIEFLIMTNLSERAKPSIPETFKPNENEETLTDVSWCINLMPKPRKEHNNKQTCKPVSTVNTNENTTNQTNRFNLRTH